MTIDAYHPDVLVGLRDLETYKKRIWLAEAYGDIISAIRLSLGASSLAIRFGLYHRAVSFDDYAVENLGSLPPTISPSVRASTVVGLQKSGLHHLVLGNMPLAAKQLEFAQLLVDDSVSRRARANVHWSAAVLSQWRHEPLLGLSHALHAWEYYSKWGPADERLCLRVDIATLAMDLAETAVAEGAYTSFYAHLRLADQHLRKAYLRYHSWFAPGADAILPIAHVRLSRLSNANENRIKMIEDTLELTLRHRDEAGYGQAVTALGQEIAWLGRLDAARDIYIKAFESLRRSPVPGLALAPMRALMLDEEFRIR